MEVHYDIHKLPTFKKAVITIGTFDGVHKGHEKIIRAVKTRAGSIGGEAVIITFHPHPRKVVNPFSSLQLINTLPEKIDLLSAKGIDHLVIVPFTSKFADLDAEQYISDFIVDLFHPASIIIGYDHHFGKDRRGNFLLLEQHKVKYNYELVEIPKHVLHQIDISSTQIRNAIRDGNISLANELLGYSFFFEGKVVKGDGLGRTLGYPTANLVYTDEDKIQLGNGVYAVEVLINNELKKGMLSIGNRPTLKDSEQKVEVNIFDFTADLYGTTLTVIVNKFLRPQQKFSSLSDLTVQMNKDKENALSG